MRVLRRQFAGRHAFFDQPQEHVAKRAAAAHALGFHVRIDRFDDESVRQPRPGQGAADEGGDRQPQALAGRLRPLAMRSMIATSWATAALRTSTNSSALDGKWR